MSKFISGSRAKNAIPDKTVVDLIRERIRTTEPDYMLLWFDISIATGYRVADVCGLKFSEVNYRKGSISILQGKEFNIARTMTARRVLSEIKQEKMSAASNARDYKAYHDLSMMTCEQFAGVEASKRIDLCLAKLVHSESERLLPLDILDRIVALRRINQNDDFIFSRSLLNSNRAKNKQGHITRQSIWRRMRTVSDWYAEAYDPSLKLSAISARKATIFEVLKIDPVKAMADYGIKSMDDAFEIINLPSVSQTCTGATPIHHIATLICEGVSQ